jgi:hypothetical protein
VCLGCRRECARHARSAVHCVCRARLISFGKSCVEVLFGIANVDVYGVAVEVAVAVVAKQDG